jgi:hypothetical protein
MAQVADLDLHFDQHAPPLWRDAGSFPGWFHHSSLAEINEATEKLDIQSRSRGGGGMPLHGQDEPALVLRLDCLDHAVQGARADAKAAGQTLHRPAMQAVDHELALTIQLGETRARQHVDRVPQAGFRWMAML